MTVLAFIFKNAPDRNVNNLRKVTVNGVRASVTKLATMPLTLGMRVEFAPLRKGGCYTTLVVVG